MTKLPRVASDVPLLLADVCRRHPGVEVRLLRVLTELPGMLDFIADAATRGPA